MKRKNINEKLNDYLFIPLKGEHYDSFLDGSKKHEYRRYTGKTWNVKTCRVGRAALLSKGYGKRHRAIGTIVSFDVIDGNFLSPDLRKIFDSIYPGWIESGRTIAKIGIEVSK